MPNNPNGRGPRPDRGAMKWEVRRRLQGRLFKAFLVCLIPQLLPRLLQLFPADVGPFVGILAEDSLLLGFPLLLSGLAFLAGVFVTDPMRVRQVRYFMVLNIQPERLPSPLWVCDCFGARYWRNLAAMLAYRVLVSLAWIAPLGLGLLIPGVASVAVVEGIPALVPGASFLWVVLPAVGLTLYAELTLSMTPYLLAASPSIPALRALVESARVMRGRKWELLRLQISFFGWILFAAMSFLIGSVFVMPYIEGTMAAYFLEIDPPSDAARVESPAPPEPDAAG